MGKSAQKTLSILAVVCTSALCVPAAFAQDCPFGLVEDPAPGQCGLYGDENKDAVCDLSQTSPAQSAASGSESIKLKKYPFFSILLPLLAIYIATWLCAKSALITRTAHRMIWNFLLLLFFLVCAALGAILILRINYGILAEPPFNLLYWHVEAGLAMAAVSVIHVFWHLNYYHCAVRNLFRKDKPEQCP